MSVFRITRQQQQQQQKYFVYKHIQLFGYYVGWVQKPMAFATKTAIPEVEFLG